MRHVSWKETIRKRMGAISLKGFIARLSVCTHALGSQNFTKVVFLKCGSLWKRLITSHCTGFYTKIKLSKTHHLVVDTGSFGATHVVIGFKDFSTVDCCFGVADQKCNMNMLYPWYTISVFHRYIAKFVLLERRFGRFAKSAMDIAWFWSSQNCTLSVQLSNSCTHSKVAQHCNKQLDHNCHENRCK